VRTQFANRSVPRKDHPRLFSAILSRDKKCRKGLPQMTNIFIGGLEYAMTEAELRKLFEKFGSVAKLTIVRDRETDRSRGFGFVEMTNESEAAAAIAGLNGKTARAAK
jgi:RNA recognition motif-containing protein